jgi:hypothetical protein
VLRERNTLVAVGGHRVQRIEHRRPVVGHGAKESESSGPRHGLNSVERGRQQDSDSHDDGEQGYEAAALGRAPQHPDDPVIDDRETEHVNDHSQQDQRQAPGPAGFPRRYVDFRHIRHLDRPEARWERNY